MRYRYRMGQIRLKLGEPKERIPEKIVRGLRGAGKGLRPENLEIVRESVDARKKQDIRKVYTVDFSCDRKLNLPEAPDLTYRRAEPGMEEMACRPVIVGFGPCGMFAALVLAQQGYRPIVLERGGRVEERVAAVEKFWADGVLDPECNVQFGEGGAGTFSDGKLTTGIKDPRIRFVLESFVKAGADEDILYEHMPHIGTDVLRKVVRNLRQEIIGLGGEIRFGARVTGLVAGPVPPDSPASEADSGQRITGVRVKYREDGREEILPAENVILAVGHSSRDTFRSLKKEGVPMEQKPFSIGVRIEHPQELIDRGQYGESAGHPDLPPAVYKLNYHCANGRGVYTFCMCPGGRVIVASSEEGGVVTNGMSEKARDSGTANSGLLVDVRTTDFPDPSDPLSGVDFQEKYERLAFLNGGGGYRPPRTTWGCFRDGERSAAPVLDSLPEFCTEAIREAMPHLGRKLRGFDRDDAVMTAVETRSSSPVRILRDRGSLMSTVAGLYPGGEGAGYAGGITSSACDGIRIAEKIISRYRIPD